MSDYEQLAYYTELKYRERPQLPDYPDMRRGYSTTPSLRKLIELSETADGLKSVHDFTISRAGFGSIRWAGVTDIRGLPLADIVQIEDGAVSGPLLHSVIVCFYRKSFVSWMCVLI